MKKLLLAAAMVLGLAGMSWAQNKGTGSADVAANIVAGISLTSPSKTLTFGNASGVIVQGGYAATDTNIATTSSGAVMFTLKYDGTQPVTVTFTNDPVSLTATGGSTGVEFNPAMGYSTTNTNASVNNITSGTAFTLTGGVHDQTLYLFLGGNVTGISGATPGDYTGTCQVQVAY